MAIKWCKTCGGIMYDPPIGAPHKCPPKFLVVYDEYDPEHEWLIFANDHEHAVEKWANKYDADDYTYDIAWHKDNPTVKVRRYNETQWHKYSVRGEIVPTYHAEKVE